MKDTQESLIKELEVARGCFYIIMKSLLNKNNTYHLDLIMQGVSYKSVAFITEFIELIRKGNYIVAISILRIHFDTLLSLYAFFIVKDQKIDQMAEAIINQEVKNFKGIKDREGNIEIKHFKDDLDQQMLFSYLEERFVKDSKNSQYQYIQKGLFNFSSKYAHFGYMAIFSSVEAMDMGKEAQIELLKEDFVPNTTKFIDNLTALNIMIDITKAQLSYIAEWNKLKESLSTENTSK